MTNETRTADDIERDIENERSQMTGTINELQKKFSVESIVDDVRHMFQGQSGDIGRAITQTIGRNPGAVVLTGIGLAWLLIGSGRQSESTAAVGQSTGQRMPWMTQPPGRLETGAARSYPSADQVSRQVSRDIYGNDTSGIDRSWINDHRSRTGAASIDDTAAGDGILASGRATLGAGIAGATDAVTGAATMVRDAVVDMSEQFLHGTEGFSEAAKSRVLAARQAAYDARDAADAVIRTSSQKAASLFDDQPLVVGALAVALGAAIGGSLPHTRTEDDAMGTTRDSLFAEAQRIYAEERSKAVSVLRVASETAKNSVSEATSDIAALVPKGKTAAGEVVDRFADAATRVLDSAKQEADRQGLGQRGD